MVSQALMIIAVLALTAASVTATLVAALWFYPLHMLAVALTVCATAVWHTGLRFYLLSFFSTYLYDHPRVGKMLGIRYEDDRFWKTNRKSSRVYMEGLFLWMFQKWTGIGLTLEDHTRKAFMKMQPRQSRLLDMKPYFRTLLGKRLSVLEFEHFLARAILAETNRVFQIVPDETAAQVMEHIKLIREVVAELTGDHRKGAWIMLNNIGVLRKVSAILKTVEPHKRLLLYTPQLTLIDNFSRMMVRDGGAMQCVNVSDFLSPFTRYSTFIVDGQLTFVSRHGDDENTHLNKAFGPRGLQCPAAVYSVAFIRGILELLQSLHITTEGKARVQGSVFKNIVNKEEVHFTFRVADTPESRALWGVQEDDASGDIVSQTQTNPGSTEAA